jgi:hypothetical protein
VTSADPALEQAREHVKAVRDFAYHLMTYVLVNALLIVIDLRGGGEGDILGLDWAYWLVLFWGFGIAGHAIWVFFGEHRAQKLYRRRHGA